MPDAQRREAILDQLRYLADEAEMLRQVVGRVPEPVQEARARPDSLSLKETLALLAGLDAHVRLLALERLSAGDQPETSVAEAALVANAHAHPARALLDQLIASRQSLVAAAEALRPAEWTRVESFLYEVTQEDAEKLRALTQQLFDAQGLGR